jgi:hypothetical protein
MIFDKGCGRSIYTELDRRMFREFMGFRDDLTDNMKKFVKECYPIWCQDNLGKMCCLTCSNSGRLVSGAGIFKPHLYCTLKKEQVGFRCGCMRWIGRL